MRRLLYRVDQWITDTGMEAPPAELIRDTVLPPISRTSVDADRENIPSLVWATGFRPDFNWLSLPVFDRKGQIQHDGGVVSFPGVYILGHPFMRTRKSSYIAGIVEDARFVCEHMSNHLYV
jgi:putative flavoprotein involved in K+ transport